jgi:acetoin:2,6-dichlorophenolindophenol oxidoreductase subunit alpha
MSRVQTGPGPETANPATMLRLYRIMLRIREFETQAARLLAQGRIEGSLHLSTGQEAVAAGVCDVLDVEDHITTTHRGHGHCLAKGADPRRMMAELFGRSDGYCLGRSGSMHIADPSSGNLGANAIVGAGIAIAVGSAYESKVRGRSRVAVPFFGEGAVAEGIFHESMNLAALWQLPVVFVCENNGYAEMSPMSLHLPVQDVGEFAAPFGMPVAVVDGNDALAVRHQAYVAVQRARTGGGPAFIECKTYRLHGHYEGDQQQYRPKAEVENWRDRDPLRLLRAACLGAATASEKELTALEDLVAEELAEAVEWAQSRQTQDATALTSHVYRDDGCFESSWEAQKRLEE